MLYRLNLAFPLEPAQHGWPCKEHLAPSDIAVRLIKAAPKPQQGTAHGGGGGGGRKQEKKRDQKYIANEESEAM